MRHRPTPQVSPALRLSAAAVLVAGLGCTPRPEQPAGAPVEHTVRKVTPETMPEAAPGGPKPAASTKDEFERALRANLERLDEEIRELKMRLSSLKESATADVKEKIAAVDAKRQVAEAKLDEVRKSAGLAWEHLEEGAERAWDELEEAVRQARNAF